MYGWTIWEYRIRPVPQRQNLLTTASSLSCASEAGRSTSPATDRAVASLCRVA
jgi:hypothetical protein